MILYFDTETTGLYPGNVCQLSYIMQDNSCTRAKNFYFTVDSVEYNAYLVHGLSKEILLSLSEGRRFSDNIDEIICDFENADLIVSHNTSFDFMFMRKEFEACGKVFQIKNEFCSMKGTVSLCKLPKKRGAGYKYPKLNELCSHFSISEVEISKATEKLFDCDSTFHDARYDSTAVYLAMNVGMLEDSTLKKLKGYL